MLFDSICGCIERHLPEYRSILDEVKLFVFEGVPHEFLKQRKGFHKDFHQTFFHLQIGRAHV